MKKSILNYLQWLNNAASSHQHIVESIIVIDEEGEIFIDHQSNPNIQDFFNNSRSYCQADIISFFGDTWSFTDMRIMNYWERYIDKGIIPKALIKITN